MRICPSSSVPAAALLIAALAAGHGCSNRKSPDETPAPLVGVVVAAQAHPGGGDMGGYIALVRGEQETDLSFKTGGIVDLIGPEKGRDWDQGTPIAKGQLLARLAQGDALNQVKAAQARADLDRADHERMKSLWENKAVSVQDLERQDSARKASEAALAQARQALADSAMLAPFDGAILLRFIRGGEMVAPGQAALRVANLATVAVEAGVPDSALAGIKPGAMYPVSIAALADRKLEGKVAEVGVAARPEDGLFKVVLKLPNAQGLIKPGMTATVVFDAAGSASPPAPAVLLPLSALCADARDELAVFLADPATGKIRRQAVKTGDIVKSSIAILEGVKPGDTVVVSGVGALYDGATVRTQPCTMESAVHP